MNYKQQMNLQSHQVSHVKVRKMIDKEWDSEAWNIDIWLDLNETDHLETPGHSDSHLTSGRSLPSHVFLSLKALQ